VERKLIATSTEPDSLFEAFLAHLKKAAMPSIVIEAATRVYKNVLRQDVFLKSAKNYLTHPIRVAANYASTLEAVEADDIVLALCHNLKEHLGDAFRNISESDLPDRIKSQIDIMTIDRSQEKDRNYLMNYYDGIENHSSNLILLKGLDKLDNAFIWVLRDLEERHWQIMFDFVCPRVAKVDHELAVYINDLTNYVIDGPKKHELRNKFQSHVDKIQERENRIGESHGN
jgi:hypothetical protein